jgi:ketosteroid isomerase-like protein
MSRKNVGTFRRAVDAFNRRDLEAFLSISAEDIEWHPFLHSGVEGLPYRGHDGIREWFADTDAGWSEIWAEVEEERDLGATVLAFGRFRARGRESGVELSTPVAWVCEFRGDEVGRAWTFTSRDDALEAAGLRE